MTDWESDYEGCMKATAPIPRPNPSIPFDRLLNLNNRAMQHGLSIVIEELMDEPDYQQYLMFVQYLYLERDHHDEI